MSTPPAFKMRFCAEFNSAVLIPPIVRFAFAEYAIVVGCAGKELFVPLMVSDPVVFEMRISLETAMLDKFTEELAVFKIASDCECSVRAFAVTDAFVILKLIGAAFPFARNCPMLPLLAVSETCVAALSN